MIGNIFYDPNPQIGMLYSGATSPSGVHVLQLPFQSPVQVSLTEAQLAAVFTPPAAPPIVTEIVSLSLVGGGPPPPALRTRDRRDVLRPGTAASSPRS